MGVVRYALLVAGWLLPGACSSSTTAGDGADVVVRHEAKVKEALEMQGDEAGQLIRRTHQNVRRYEELRIEGQTQAMAAMRQTIGRTVDEDFDVFRAQALDAGSLTLRNWAVACIGFAIEKRAAARKLLESLLTAPDQPPWVLANACLALRVLRDPETDLTVLIPFIGNADPEVRTNAATALGELWGGMQTPRELTPQHYAAIDRLVSLLHDPATTRGRRAAVIALANLRHPDVLDHLVSALQDPDPVVQIGGLMGIERLGDARALDPLFEYLEGSPSDEAASWAVNALKAIAVQNGFTQTPSELDSLGTSGRQWRKWFRAQRTK